MAEQDQPVSSFLQQVAHQEEAMSAASLVQAAAAIARQQAGLLEDDPLDGPMLTRAELESKYLSSGSLAMGEAAGAVAAAGEGRHGGGGGKRAAAMAVGPRGLQTVIARRYDLAVNGPLYPTFIEDIPTNGSDAFIKPAFQQKKQFYVPVSVPTPRACLRANLPRCRTVLNGCLAKNARSYDNICGCYEAFATCYTSNNCFEVLPRADVNYCWEVLHCTRNECEARSGAGAAGLAVGTLALAGLALVANAVLRGREEEEEGEGEQEEEGHILPHARSSEEEVQGYRPSPSCLKQ